MTSDFKTEMSIHRKQAKKNYMVFSVFVFHIVVMTAMILSKIVIFLNSSSTLFSVTYSLILSIALFEQFYLTQKSYKQFMEK
jgi:uncharacterized membrane protein YGL010W